MRQLHDEIKACMDAQGISSPSLPIAEEKDMPPPAATSAYKLKTLAANHQTRAAAQNTQAQGRPQSQPQITPAPQATFIQPPPPAPAKSNMGLIAVISVLVIVVLVSGIIGFAVHQNNKREEGGSSGGVRAGRSREAGGRAQGPRR